MAQSASEIIAAAEQAADASLDETTPLLMTRSDVQAALTGPATLVDAGPRRRVFVGGRHAREARDAATTTTTTTTTTTVSSGRATRGLLDEDEDDHNDDEDVYYIAETTKKRLKAKRLRYEGYTSLEYSTYRTGYARGAEMRTHLHWNVDRQRYNLHIPRAKIMIGWLILFVLAIIIAAVFFTMALSSENIYSVRWGIIFWIASHTLAGGGGRSDTAVVGAEVHSSSSGGGESDAVSRADASYINGLLALFPVFLALNMTLACVSALLVVYLSPGAAGSGLPEMRAFLNGVRMRSALSWRALVAKVLGTILALSSGLFVGKEGPLAQIGCIIAASFGKRPRSANNTERSPRPYPYDHERQRRQGEEEEEEKYKLNVAEDDEEEDDDATTPILGRVLWPFRTNVERRDLATAGAAAGIAVAFNAPIGGVMFAFEEMATWWRNELTWKAFFCCAVGVIALRLLNGTCTSQKRCGYYAPTREFALWSVNFDSNDDMLPDTGGIGKVLFDRIPVVVIGVTGGVLGAVLVSVNSRLLGLRERFFGPPKSRGWRQIVDVVVISLVSSVALFWLPYFFGRCQDNPSSAHHVGWSNTYELFVRYNCPVGEYNDLALLMTGSQTNSIKLLFSSPSKSTRTVSQMSLIVFAGQALALVAVTNGSSIPSGIFTPCIVIGAAMGRVLGILLRAQGFHDVDPAVCALLGSAAFVSGVLRRTVSLGVVLIEVANATMVVPSLMLTMLIAKSVGDRFNASITDEHMRIKEIPFLSQQPAAITRGLQLSAGDVMAKKPVTIHVIERVGRLVDILRSCQHSAFPLVDRRGGDLSTPTCEGIITRECVVAALQTGNFSTDRETAAMRRRQQHSGTRRHTAEGSARDLNPNALRTLNRGKFAQSARMRNVVVTKSEEKDEEAVTLRMDPRRHDLFVDLSDFMLPNPVVAEDTPLEMTYELFRSMALRHLPVVRSFKEIVGMVSRVDLLSLEEPVVRRLEEISNAVEDEEAEAQLASDGAPSASERVRTTKGKRSIPTGLANFVNDYYGSVDNDIETPFFPSSVRRQ